MLLALTHILYSLTKAPILPLHQSAWLRSVLSFINVLQTLSLWKMASLAA